VTRPGLRRPATRDETQYAGPGHGFGAAGRAELAQDVAHMPLTLSRGDYQFTGTGLV